MAARCVILLLLAPITMALSSTTPRQIHDSNLKRRAFFNNGFGLAAAVGVFSAPSPSSAKELSLAPVELLYDELVDLKAQVRKGLRGNPVNRVVEYSLDPMQRAMEKNPNNGQGDTTRALELKGHMFELAQAVRIVAKATVAFFP